MACCFMSQASGAVASTGRSRRDSSTYGITAYVQKVQRLALTVVICVAIWAVSGGGAFWPAWVILVAGIILVRNTYATFVLPTRGRLST